MRQKFKVFLYLVVTTVFLIYIYSRCLFRPTDYTYLITQDPDIVEERDEIQKLAKKLKNLPIEYWYESRDFRMQFNDSCAPFPDILNIRLVHQFWQEFITSNGSFKLFGAYLDDRNITNRVRILTMVDKTKPTVSTYCQLWFQQNTKPIIVPVYEYFYLWHEYWGSPPDGIFRPYLLSCALPPNVSFMVPVVVSLVEHECYRASNSLIVNYNKPTKDNPKRNFAVCIKGLNFVQDITLRLVEWIELLRLLGVDKIIFYNIIAHGNVNRLLDHYEKQGIIEMNPLTLSQITLDEPFLEHLYLQHEGNLQPEVIPYNDCFLKNMYLFDYISVLDVDEVIIPNGNLTNWMDLISVTKQKVIEERGSEACSYMARNCYFFDNMTIENVKGLIDPETYEKQHEMVGDTPRFLHMLGHVYRSKNCSEPGYYVKSIHDTNSVLAVHNHMPLATLTNNDYCYFGMQLEDGYMHHYRADCPGEIKNVCYENYKKDFIFDDAILKYKDALLQNVISVLDIIGY